MASGTIPKETILTSIRSVQLHLNKTLMQPSWFRKTSLEMENRRKESAVNS